MTEKTRRIPFVKMHGAGNDFVFLNREETDVQITKKLAQLLLDRHFGIGGDQLLVLEPGNTVKNSSLEIYNSDGSMAEMCGNGVRAVAFYLRDFKGYDKDFIIDTKAGPIGIGLKDNAIEVDMGEPILEGKKIPTTKTGPIEDLAIKAGDKTFRINAVSMGNPHAVTFVPNVDEFPATEYGPLLENHNFFPNRANIEFVQVLSKNHVKARVWERGAGETLACGTGACAIAVAAARLELTGRNVKVDLPGGTLTVRWADNNRVYLSGPAEVTFTGIFSI
jgi:diaminopimelate epimerase